MKTSKYIAIIIALTIFAAACSKDDSNDLVPDQPTSYLTEGEWAVSYYSERGKVETDHFTNYRITFANDGSFTLSNDNESFTGSWTYIKNSDDSLSKEKLLINIMGNDIADKLNEDWAIIEISNTEIHLVDDNDEHSEVLKINRL